MPQSKNVFYKGKMNKDLNERLIQNGEYVDARNVTITDSTEGDSGLIENVAGNSIASSFGLTDPTLDIIGFFVDGSKDRIYVFVTNWNDTSIDGVSRFAADNSSHYIFMYDQVTGISRKLVDGTFLNFSKRSRIDNVNIIGDLLFWTDNRNQPRRINVEKALQNSSLYFNEEQISILKYYPYTPIRLTKRTTTGLLLKNSSFTVTTQPISITDGTYSFTSSGSTFEVEAFGNYIGSIVCTFATAGFSPGSTITIPSGTLTGQIGNIQFLVTEDNLDQESTMFDKASEELPISEDTTITLLSSTSFSASPALDPEWIGSVISAKDSSGNTVLSASEGIKITNIAGSTVLHDSTTALSTGDTVTAGANPYYDEEYDGDPSHLEERFVRFSYRFKFEDNEYSLIAPFSQHAFIPKQDGYFLEDSVPTNIFNEVDSDENKAIRSTIVSFFENKVNSSDLMIDLPEGCSTVSDLASQLNVSSVEFLYKDSDESVIKVIDSVDVEDLEESVRIYGSNQIKFTYDASKPIKTLPSSDYSRASDIAPIRALTQEVSGNRVIYGNYLAKSSVPSKLDYRLTSGKKTEKGELNSVNQVEYPNHSLKQNRTYQAGIVLVDKFGRMSDVITSDENTVYNPYRIENTGFITPQSTYLGDSLKLQFLSPIPSVINEDNYVGVYSNKNPLGWYSYKVVIKQTEQDYYNIYAPTILNNTPNNSPTTSQEESFITLFGDNVNKVPRDLNNVGPLDVVYRASNEKYTGERIDKLLDQAKSIFGESRYDFVVSKFERYAKGRVSAKGVSSSNNAEVNIFPRVHNTTFNAAQSTNVQYFPSKTPDKIVEIGLRDDLGLDKDESGSAYTASPFYGIPLVSEKGSNPFIGRVSTDKQLGATGGPSAGEVTFSKVRLNVLETAPFESDIDIYYETSTSGLISDLNFEIENGLDPNFIYQVGDFTFLLNEASDLGDAISTDFTPQNVLGANVLNASTTCEIVHVWNGGGADFASRFDVVKNPDNTFKLLLKNTPDNWFTYTANSYIYDNFKFVLRFSNTVSGTAYERIVTIDYDNKLENTEPAFIDSGVPTTYIDLTQGITNAVDAQNDASYPYEEFDGSASVGEVILTALDARNGSAGNVPFYFKDEIVLSIKKLQYWAEFESPQVFVDIPTDEPLFDWTGNISGGVPMIDLIKTSSQTYSDLDETSVFTATLRCLNVNQPIGDDEVWFEPGRIATRFKMTVEAKDANGTGLSKEVEIDFWLKRNPNRYG